MQVERFIKKVAQKFPTVEESEASLLTDIHIRVSQDSGEMLAFDDDDVEITRCVVEQWIDCKDENFYDEIADCLRGLLRKNAEIIDNLGLLIDALHMLHIEPLGNLPAGESRHSQVLRHLLQFCKGKTQKIFFFVIHTAKIRFFGEKVLSLPHILI